MANRREGRGHGPAGEQWIAELLHEEADRYEPDRLRIWSRISEGVQEAPPARAPRRDRPAARPRRTGWNGWRTAWVLPGAAAATVGLTVAGIAGISRLGTPGTPPSERIVVTGQHPESTGTIAPPATSGVPLPTADGTTTQAPEPPAPTARRTPDGGRNPGGGGTGGGAGTGGNTVTAPGLEVRTDPVSPGFAVRLGSGLADWIVAGRSDGVLVRRKDGPQLISGPHDQGSVRREAARGPFSVAWSGGMPEQDRSGLESWLTVPAPAGGPETGLFVAAPGDRDGTLVLYVGAVSADARLVVTAPSGTQQEIRLPASRKGGGHVVTIRFRGGGPEVRAQLVAGAGGAIGFQAAALRR